MEQEDNPVGKLCHELTHTVHSLQNLIELFGNQDTVEIKLQRKNIEKRTFRASTAPLQRISQGRRS